MIYQHPLAYLVGLEGLALLRGWAGDFDSEFVRDRLVEVRQLLDNPLLADHPGVRVQRSDVLTGYRQWAPTYDEPNSLFDAEEPVMHEILNGLSTGTALDAACGTGRHAAYLQERGHRIIAVDRSPEMLEVAQRRLPDADVREGDLERLPLEAASVDLVVCALALAHVADLAPVMSEFARVLRPGGNLVISDAHHELVIRGSVVKALGPSGEPGLVETYRHTPGDFLRAALPAGFAVRRCEEPAPRTASYVRSTEPTPDIKVEPWDTWPWSLLDLIPGAARAAWATPSTIIWHFQLASS